MQILCIVTAQGDGQCSTYICTVKIAVHSSKGCDTGTTMGLNCIKQEYLLACMARRSTSTKNNVTLNNGKRLAWASNLANEIPLLYSLF